MIKLTPEVKLQTLTKREYHRTPKGLVHKIYDGQLLTSKKRGHPVPTYTREELEEWVFENSNFDTLFSKWIESGYDTKLTPSVDRLDDYKPYTMYNIQLVTWGENNRRSHSDRKNGINNKHSRAVVQLTLDWKIIKHHNSIRGAGRAVNGFDANIQKVASGKYDTAYGFRWMYEDVLQSLCDNAVEKEKERIRLRLDSIVYAHLWGDYGRSLTEVYDGCEKLLKSLNTKNND